jgi:hypothetical protein
MRLTVFNGSPRAKRGNTEVLLGDLIRGFTEVDGNSAEVHYLNTETRRRQAAAAFATSEIVLLCFPLYHHAMPGIVMTWLETLEPLDAGRNTKMAFLVQSGLPEARQSRCVERFLERLPARLGCAYLGTMIRGGVEAMQFAPEFMFRRMRRTLVDLGRELATTGRFDPKTIARLAGREALPWWRIRVFLAMKAVGVADRSWNDLLKKNGAWAERFDRPHASTCDHMPPKACMNGGKRTRNAHGCSAATTQKLQ